MRSAEPREVPARLANSSADTAAPMARQAPE